MGRKCVLINYGGYNISDLNHPVTLGQQTDHLTYRFCVPALKEQKMRTVNSEPDDDNHYAKRQHPEHGYTENVPGHIYLQTIANVFDCIRVMPRPMDLPMLADAGQAPFEWSNSTPTILMETM
jgi:hypothetical protein